MDYKFEIASLYEEMMLLEFSDAAIRKIAAKFSADASEEDVRRELADFEKYKAKIEKKDPFQYKTWIELTEVIHAAKAASAQKKDFKKTDVEGVANADDIVADDDNVTIYRGDSQDRCVLYGRGYSFCISRPAGGNMFTNYRLGKESTFYFIFFKKKSPEENDHIMVLDHTKNGYEWTFKNNKTQSVDGGWDEIVASYPELAKYKDILQNKKLTKEERVFATRLQRFARNPSLQAFREFTYEEQAHALKSIVNLPDEIWGVLDSTLRNEFISIGPNLTEDQADDLKPNEEARYKKTRALSFDQLAQGILLKVNKHDDINQIISKPNYAYDYAKDVLKGQNVPDEFIKSIASDPEYAYHYARDVLKGQNVPDEIIKSIASSEYYAYDYAEDVLKWQNVPDEIIKRIASASDYAYIYARDAPKGQNVPDIIIKRIASSTYYAYDYARNVLKWQNVPSEIIKSIQDSGREIPPETTIKENTTRILTNFDQLFERVCFMKDL